MGEKTLTGNSSVTTLKDSSDQGTANDGPPPPPPDATPVELFEQLERRLTRASVSASVANRDPEKGQGKDPDVFDLRDYLTSTNDANNSAGIKHKHVGVTWENLTVTVFGGVGFKVYGATFGSALINFVLIPFTLIMSLVQTIWRPKQGPTRTVIDGFEGVLKPGEMCLVLGRPGAGCTTFLKTIGNNRAGYASIAGDVQYAGITAAEMAKLYPGEVTYNQEDDIHMPALTVSQTLDFALSTKTPGKRIPGMTKKAFGAELRDTILKMLNMTHTANTLVGNAFIRGVSGGERKRVSIAEMMATRAHVCSWDNSTRGLDASTALDFTRNLRVMTDVMGQTTFVSLYQAGENIYRLFDKILLIDDGRQVYFGPASEARQYFIDLGYEDQPRSTTADYLTGCTDPNERKFAAGRSSEDVPSTSVTMADAFRASKQFAAMRAQRLEYQSLMETEKHDQEQFRLAVTEAKRRGVSKKSPYTISFFEQVKVLTARQFRLQLQDRFSLFTSFGLSMVLALVSGAAFYNLPISSAGAFTRGGIIFLAVLVNCFDAFAEIPMAVVGRPILYKQVDYRFFTPSALALGNLFADLPFSATRVFIFDLIVYFLANLKRDAGAFWTFHLFNYVTFLAMQGFFRALGILCANFDQAFRAAVFFMPNFITYTGYIIPVYDMPRWLFWIYYVNPIAYGFAAILENEFMRIDLPCDGASVIPRNGPGITKYPARGPNQTCTLLGSTPGNEMVRGFDYIRSSFGLDANDLWRLNLPVLIGFFFLFLAIQMIVLEKHRHPIFGGAMAIYAKENADTKKRNERLEERKNEKRVEQKIQETAGSGRPFTWKGVNYVVPVPGGTRRLLTNVSGYVKPGTLTALMGASGAGKTTCLDVLAQRKNIGVVTGDILLDGHKLDKYFARKTAYAEQMDVHVETATVREALRFSAYLRQPFSVPREEKDAYVEEILEVLELQDHSEALVFSLSVEARKRLTIGVELASKPEMCWLDEPTSGLDSQSAWNIVRFLRKLADSGQTILCTIHQPSAMLFESFDRLLLLQSGGETVYFGNIGADAQIIRSYFARNGAVCPPTSNMAEFMLEAIGAGVAPRLGDRDWHEIWTDSAESQKLEEEVKALNDDALAKPGDGTEVQEEYATPFWYQLSVVTQRTFVALWRSPDYVFTRLFVHLFISFFVSMALIQLGHSVRDLQYRVFGIFWVTVLPAIVQAQIEPIFIFNRMIFIREASSGIYSPYVFAIGQLMSEVPYSIICAFVYWVLMVWPMGFGQGSAGSAGAGYSFLMVVFVEMFGVALGQAIAAISPNIRIASLINPPIGLILSTFAGVTIPYPVMPDFWIWLYQLSPYTRVLGGMLANELDGLSIVCRPDEFAVFDPPQGQSCQVWAGEFVDTFGGYLNNRDATAACQYCPYKSGNEFLAPLALDFNNRWRDLFILLAFFVANVVITIVASRLFRFAKR